MKPEDERSVLITGSSSGIGKCVAEALHQRGINILNVREGMHGSDTGPGWLNRSLPIRAPDQPRVE